MYKFLKENILQLRYIDDLGTVVRIAHQGRVNFDVYYISRPKEPWFRLIPSLKPYKFLKIIQIWSLVNINTHHNILVSNAIYRPYICSYKVIQA